MKKLIVFILILVNNYLVACGFYPYGEDIRMRLLNVQPYGFEGFQFTTHYLYGYSSDYPIKNNPNSFAWFQYCKGKVSVEAIERAVYDIQIDQFTEKNNNEMIQYLYQQKDFEAINYLKFAKSCEAGNSFYSDPWERTENIEIKTIKESIEKAISNSKLSKNKWIQLRYKFLAIRMAFYGNRPNDIIKIYNTISFPKNPSIVHYWCMYFRAIIEEDKALQSFYAAQVFANASDKRFAIYSYFDKNIEVNSILKYAKTNIEKVNVYAFMATKNIDQSLKYIKKAYQYNPKSDFNDLILIREIQKIEDWVFTPYYTNFLPSIKENYRNWDDIFSYTKIQNRIKKDRIYANEVYNFLNTIKKPSLRIELYKAHLTFVVQKYEKSLSILNQLERKIKPKDSLDKDIEMIKSLNLTANQTQNNAIIKPYVQKILMKNKENKNFIFAVARELEYLENTTDAAFLFSKATSDFGTFWKSRKSKKGSYRDYFDNYFSYVDVIYTPKQLEDILENISKNKNKKDEFTNWLNENINEDQTKLLDLLGTKYIRQNNLSKASKIFNNIDDRYWRDNYSLWNSTYHSTSKIFDKNPFFTLKYTNDFIKTREDFYLTKASVTNKLIEYIKKANQKKEKNRDYYYFLVANCYKNMTIEGNSWMLRRSGISINDVEPFPEDHLEFTNGNLSKMYYRKAASLSKSTKFKSLCLWLAKDYKTLQKTHENEYEELSNRNCYAFEAFFNDRKMW